MTASTTSGPAADHAHATTIIVNGRQKSVSAKELTFAEVVALAYDPGTAGLDPFFTVTFQRGEGHKPEGTLVDGETLRVHEGMIIHVSATNRS